MPTGGFVIKVRGVWYFAAAGRNGPDGNQMLRRYAIVDDPGSVGTTYLYTSFSKYGTAYQTMIFPKTKSVNTHKDKEAA